MEHLGAHLLWIHVQTRRQQGMSFTLNISQPAPTYWENFPLSYPFWANWALKYTIPSHYTGCYGGTSKKTNPSGITHPGFHMFPQIITILTILTVISQGTSSGSSNLPWRMRAAISWSRIIRRAPSSPKKNEFFTKSLSTKNGAWINK